MVCGFFNGISVFILNNFYLCFVKQKLFTFFLILAGMLYLSSVLELDKEEAKDNFKQEQQSCIATVKTATGVHLEIHGTGLPVFFSVNPFSRYFSILPGRETVSALPPEKIFIKNSVFLI